MGLEKQNSKKAFLILIVLFFSLAQITWAQVDFQSAKKVALNWYRFFAPQVKKSGTINSNQTIDNTGKTTIYVFCFNTGGFVMISANEAVEPVLGYSYSMEADEEILHQSGRYCMEADEEISHPSVKYWVDNYSNTINDIGHQT